MITAFIHGFLLAFGLIIPLGIQNIFVFNQGANQPLFVYALPSIITAALCDTLLIFLAVLGVSVIVLEMSWLKSIVFGVGLLFLLYIGGVIWKTKAEPHKVHKESLPASRQILFAISVSLLNPHALIDSIAVIGTNSLSYSGMEKWVYTLACVLVSCLWFLGLAAAGHKLREFDPSGLWFTRVNKLSALIIWSVAAYIAWQLLCMGRGI